MDAQQEKIFEKAFGSLFTKHKQEEEDAKTGGSLAAVGTQPTGPASLVQKGWIKNDKDAAQLKERGCSALFYDERGQKCSCADRLTQTIAARSVDNKTTLYADPHWRLIQDAQRTDVKGPLGLHYTAWSLHPEFHTVNDLRDEHKDMLATLKKKALDAIARAMQERGTPIDPNEIHLFAQYPPNIFQLHIHFIYGSPPPSLQDKVISFEELPLKHIRDPVPLECKDWH